MPLVVILNQLAHSEVRSFWLYIFHINIHYTVDAHLGRDCFVGSGLWAGLLASFRLWSSSSMLSAVPRLGRSTRLL